MALRSTESPPFLSASFTGGGSESFNTAGKRSADGSTPTSQQSVGAAKSPSKSSANSGTNINNNGNNNNNNINLPLAAQPLLPATTLNANFNKKLTSPVSPAFSAASSAPLSFSGWIWKYAVGTSAVFKRANWQLRFFRSNTESISYYDKEPFDSNNCKRAIRWKDVTHVYDVLNSGVHKQASDPERFYFGIRFYAVAGSDEEFVLVLRLDNASERLQWVAHLLAVQSKINNMSMTATGPIYGFSNARDSLFAEGSGDEDANNNNNNNNNAEGLERRSAKGRGWLVEALALPLRNMVSLQKKRFKQDGFDLDLAYIDDDIIALGYPSIGKDSFFRNPYDEVVKFLELKHGKRYHVFNLCSERFYPPSSFEGKFDRFPFDDHNAPPIDLFLPFCHRAAEILRRPVDANGKPWAIAVHCKAGKGRTGAMIAALLMYLGRCANDKEAIEYFARKRTKDKKGVQIPSQIRYVNYFYQIRAFYNDDLPPPQKVVMKQLILSSIPHFDSDGGADPFILVQARRETHGHRPLGTNEGNVHNPLVTLLDTRTVTPAKHVIGVENYPVDINTTVMGDVRIVLLDQDGFGQDELMAAFWVNTSFLPRDTNGSLILRKKELDFAVKDKIRIDESFYVTLKYEFVK